MQTPEPTREPTPPAPSEPALPRPGRVRRVLRGLRAVLTTTAVVLFGLWATAALALTNLDGRSPRVLAPALFALALLAVLVRLRPHRRARLVALAMCVLVWIAYLCVAPSNDRVWAARYARLSTATIDGEHVTIHNYRVLERDADGKFRERYVDETFDLGKLMRVDLLMSYWGPTRIAHALVTFQFADGKYCSASIEVRRRESQKGFDPVRSLFRNFELVYVMGSEHYMIGDGLLDDYHRIFLYRSNISQARSRALFLRYANKLNELAAKPEWYNALTDNCTTGIYLHLRHIPPRPRFNVFILLNGYLPQRMHTDGLLDNTRSWQELNRLCDIKETGRRAYASPDFSKIIREQVPLPSVPPR